MSDFKLSIDDTQIKAALSEAILASISAEARDAMLREALASVVAPRKPTSYNQQPGPSLVQSSFGDAVAILARTVVREMVESDPEIRPKVEGLIRETLLKLLDETATTDTLAKMINGSLERAGY